MKSSLKGMAAAVGLTFLTACSTTPIDNAPPSSAPQEKSQNSLLGTKNPETGCFEKKETRADGTEKIVDINCPFIKDL